MDDPRIPEKGETYANYPLTIIVQAASTVGSCYYLYPNQASGEVLFD